MAQSRSPRATDVSPGREESSAARPGPEADAERIARRAYERYETRGREDGRDQEDWFEAERDLGREPGRITTAGGGHQTSTDKGPQAED
jgi:hypothetical protein